jgi:hypothetical protein
MELGPDVNKSAIKDPVTPFEWFERLEYDIKEGQLSSVQIESLLNDPNDFLVGYTNNVDMAMEMVGQVVKSYFISQLQIKADNQDVSQVLSKLCLDLLNDRISKDSDSISPVDLSQIFKNLKKEN